MINVQDMARLTGWLERRGLVVRDLYQPATTFIFASIRSFQSSGRLPDTQFSFELSLN